MQRRRSYRTGEKRTVPLRGTIPGGGGFGHPMAIDPGLSSRTGCFRRAPGDLAESCEETHEVRGQRRPHAERLPGGGMAEADLLGVQRLAREVREAGHPSAPPAAPTVDAVADDRVAERGEMHAQLVRPTRVRAEAEQRRIREPLEHLEVGDGRAWAAAPDAHPFPLARVPSEWPVDRPARARDAAVDRRQLTP